VKITKTDMMKGQQIPNQSRPRRYDALRPHV